MKLRGMRLESHSVTSSSPLKSGLTISPRYLGLKDKGKAMANHVSSLKRARQTVTRSAVNRSNRSRVRTSLRDLREALTKGDVPAAQEQYRATVSALDKSVQKGILHNN